MISNSGKDIELEEPTAEARKFARELRDVYTAMVREGFEQHDALACIALTINFHISQDK